MAAPREDRLTALLPGWADLLPDRAGASAELAHMYQRHTVDRRRGAADPLWLPPLRWCPERARRQARDLLSLRDELLHAGERYPEPRGGRRAGAGRARPHRAQALRSRPRRALLDGGRGAAAL